MKEKLKFTEFQKFLELLAVILLVILFGYLISNWSGLPARIPVHYNAGGTIDGWGSKNSLLVLPGICLLLYTLITVVSFFPKAWNVPVKLTDENRASVYTVTRSLLCVLKLVLLLTFTFIEISMVKMQPLGVWFIYLIIAGVFCSIAGFTIKIIKVSKPKEPSE
jgi:uncharacterized membrane protein